MSFWQSLCDFGIGLVQELDRAVDRGAELFHQSITPPIQEAAGRLDLWIDSTIEDTEEGIHHARVKLDERWQGFMVAHVDPLFGSSRTAQLSEMGGIVISPREQALNRRIGLSVACLAATGVGGAIFPPSLLLSVPISFLVMVPPIFEMAQESRKRLNRQVTYHVVTSINLLLIWLSGLYNSGMVATLLFFTGEKLLAVVEDRSHKGLIAVFSKQPSSVWVLRDGVEVQIAFAEVEPGDLLVVQAGGFMPVDGVVVDGLASIDQQMLTGEAQPVERGPGDPVYASTLVLSGKVQVRVDKAGSATVAAKIGETLNRTASYQLALQSKGAKMAHDSAGPILGLSAFTLATLGMDSALAILNSAFGVNVRISAPVIMLNLLNVASHNAILLKDGRSLELLNEVDTVLFDKTGTLTLSQPNVAKIHVTGPLSEDELLAYAAAAEDRQTHPIALAIVEEARARGLTLPELDQARYEVGYGLKVHIKKRRVLLGSDRFMRMENVEIPRAIEQEQAASHARGHSLIMVAVDGVLAGVIELQPTLRPEAEAVIDALRKRNLKMVIISGDQEEPTRRLAERLGMDRYFANVLPEGKASLVEQLQGEGRSVCFVGDGINDSIALKKANVSVSLRGATTVATDAAQIVLMQESLRQLPRLFELSDEMDRTMRAAMVSGIVPGALNVAGVFFLGWGFYQAMVIYSTGLFASMGISMYPLFKHRGEQQQAEESAAAVRLRPAASVPVGTP